jgi:hypothetical protein
MHLARLGVSALQDPATAPKTWAELFWLADRNWQGPVGFVATIFGRFTLKTKLSSTFLLFTATIMLALPAPIVLSRAYPAATVESQQNILLNVTLLNNTGSPQLDVYSQMAVGAGGWTTGVDVQDMYATRMYGTTDAALSSDDLSSPPDIFFTGDLQNNQVNLPGFRLQGGCTPMVADAELQATAAEANANNQSALDPFGVWCSARGLTDAPVWFDLTVVGGVNAYFHFCTKFDETVERTWMNQASGYTTTVVAWLNTTDHVTSAQGFVNCTSTFTTGQADMNNGSTNKTFDNFSHKTLFSEFGSSDQALRKTPFLPPTIATFREMSQTFSKQGDIDDERSVTVARMLGYSPQFNNTAGETKYVQPNIQDIAKSLWRGTTHMAAAVNLLGSTTQKITVVHVVTRSGRIRNETWAYVLAGLLFGWLSMLSYCTVRMFRRTFGSALDSYTAARLLTDLPFLVDGHCAGELVDNPSLRAMFETVGDSSPENDVGHVTSGGAGVLEYTRSYGARSGLVQRSTH